MLMVLSIPFLISFADTKKEEEYLLTFLRHIILHLTCLTIKIQMVSAIKTIPER